MDLYEFFHGESPLLISMPHVGTELPEEQLPRFSAAGRRLEDTDWHVDRLYDFAAGLGASIIRPRYSRYLIDLNRPPDGSELYPGASNTELCPILTFNSSPIYRENMEPSAEEIANRVTTYWRPYHDRIETQLKELKARFGFAILFDAHSIRSVVPRFFEGVLPDLNLGSGGGTSCAPQLEAMAAGICQSASTYSSVLNGRFTGGYITRRYGNPTDKVHALQLELSQRTYMQEESPFDYLPERAAAIRPVLQRLLEVMLEWAKTQRTWRPAG